MFADSNSLSTTNINTDTRNSLISTLSTKYSPPWITASIIVNSIAAILTSVALAALAVIADILGYVIYCLAKKLPVSSKEIEYFALISEVGSLIYGVLMLLALMSSKMLSYAIIEDNYCAQVSIRMMVFLNFVLNMALGFIEDHLFDHDKMMVLMWPCLWSKIIALGIVVCAGAGLWISGADNYIGRKLINLYISNYNAVDNNIGPTSNFYSEGGYKGRLVHCFTHFCQRAAVSEGYVPAGTADDDLEQYNVMVTGSSEASSNQERDPLTLRSGASSASTLSTC